MQLDYDKLHKSALELGKVLIKKNPELTEWVYSQLPELKKEKPIVDKMIDLIKEVQDDEDWHLGDWSDEAIAWLEKQKEQQTKFNKWTLQDARTGDIIVSEQMILIYKSLGRMDTDRATVYAYAGIDMNGNVQVTDDYWTILLETTRPATAEECDHLISRLANEDYTWNPETKELTKQKTLFDIDMVTPEESLGVSTETYNKIIDECLFGDDDKNK